MRELTGFFTGFPEFRRPQKRPVLAIAPFLIALGLSACAGGRTKSETAAEPGVDRVARSAPIAQSFKNTLKDELQKALVESGPAGSIQVCKTVSKQLEEEYTARYAEILRLRRISLKTRNPGRHTPSAAEAAWLRNTQAALEQNREIGPALIDGGDRDIALFPIVIDEPVCLMCHGNPEWMGEEIKTALAEHYPEDEATGFKMGDLRGALAIEWKKG